MKNCGYGTYPGGSVTDPQGPDTGSVRVIRGGGWDSIASECRSASRSDLDPGYGDGLVGFRVVLAQVSRSRTVSSRAL